MLEICSFQSIHLYIYAFFAQIPNTLNFMGAEREVPYLVARASTARHLPSLLELKGWVVEDGDGGGQGRGCPSSASFVL